MPDEDVLFFSVQDERDRRRLKDGGEPWPTGLSRAFLGSGFYAWATAGDADVYRSVLAAHAVVDTRVLAFVVPAAALLALNTFDLTRLTDAEANAWLYTYSEWASPVRLSHGYDHVIRGTTNGRHEHYFTPAAFARFRPAAGGSGVGEALQGD